MGYQHVALIALSYIKPFQ